MDRSILGFPALSGMEYPRLTEQGLLSVVEDFQALLGLGVAERAKVRVLMTSASRGFTKEVSEALPNLELVTSQGAGTDKIDFDALEDAKIKFRSIGEAVTDDVADLAMAFINMLFRNLLNADRFARSGVWEQKRFELGESLVGKTVGIAGLSGRVGQAIALRARASKMKVTGLDRPSNHGLAETLHPDWASMALASDVLVLAVPGHGSLRSVINAEVLEALGPKGYIVNVGRGSLVDTIALTDALETGAIAGAALDVLAEEPKVPERLRTLNNVILSPHIGAQTWGQRARAAAIAENEILAFLEKAEG
ncbi:NAD(P)-dependent oxidoreductase [Donghicola mangrovi]|uniref:Glyoxylate reductase n=1 Tax=Donghicola mangrovi TaxID=2729614 RepID=A0A850QEP6_9RHOB|nr:NAD(P)-dependent oxidoreductase [Donghicola mangrovi]NVO25420.1 glyoxylate reductase [Donghicola mangrovi]